MLNLAKKTEILTLDEIVDYYKNSCKNPENKKFFVTPKECDEITKSAAELISTALDMMFGMHS